MIQHNNQLLFLDWFNNFLTPPAFASYYGMTTREAIKTIEKGRLIHESQFSSILFYVCKKYEPIQLQGVDLSAHNTSEDY